MLKAGKWGEFKSMMTTNSFVTLKRGKPSLSFRQTQY
jgi:hypothetical protein